MQALAPQARGKSLISMKKEKEVLVRGRFAGTALPEQE